LVIETQLDVTEAQLAVTLPMAGPALRYKQSLDKIHKEIDQQFVQR
jgi:hypothetical protein